MKMDPSILPPVSQDDSALLNSNKQQINPHSSFMSLETSAGGIYLISGLRKSGKLVHFHQRSGEEDQLVSSRRNM